MWLGAAAKLHSGYEMIGSWNLVWWANIVVDVCVDRQYLTVRHVGIGYMCMCVGLDMDVGAAT